MEEKFLLEIGGLISPDGEHVRWPDRKLKVGDTVAVRVVETKRVDHPLSRQHRDPIAELRSQKQYVRRMARKFGWKIQTRQTRNTTKRDKASFQHANHQ